MKSKNLPYVVMALLALSLSFTAVAENRGPVQLAFQPASVTFDQDNYLIVQPRNSEILKFQYLDGGFPAGTQIRMREVTNDNGIMVTIEYMVPGSAWTQLLWDQLKCKDEACQEPEPQQSTVPEPEGDIEPFKCDFGRAAGFGLLGGGIGFGVGSIKSSADAGDAHAEVSVNPILAAVIGAILLPTADCTVQYAQWKKEHPGYKANGKKK